MTIRARFWMHGPHYERLSTCTVAFQHQLSHCAAGAQIVNDKFCLYRRAPADIMAGQMPRRINMLGSRTLAGDADDNNRARPAGSGMS
jgi:hypothetical protein